MSEDNQAVETDAIKTCRLGCRKGVCDDYPNSCEGPHHWQDEEHRWFECDGPDPEPKPAQRSVIQEWVMALPMMQQTVLLTAVRGPDGLPKYHPTKLVLRWYRRCILLSALDGKVLTDPAEPNGGSFTGPSVEGDDPRLPRWQWRMDERVTDYLRALDEVPHHFQLHLIHAAEILGYKHPDQEIRHWWNVVYERLVHDMHLWPETEEQLDARLGDSREGWLARGDVATND